MIVTGTFVRRRVILGKRDWRSIYENVLAGREMRLPKKRDGVEEGTE